jgi:hypothetical protein
MVIINLCHRKAEIDKLVNFHRLKLLVFTATGFACPPVADDFIYGLKPVALR